MSWKFAVTEFVLVLPPRPTSLSTERKFTMSSSDRNKLHPQLQNLFSDVKPPPRPKNDTGSMVVAAFAAITVSILIGVAVSSAVMWLLFGK